MLIKICQTCKKPFKALSASLYIKFCSIECVDEAYNNKQLDRETIDYALKILKKFQREREREQSAAAHVKYKDAADIDTPTLRDLFFLEILKINRLLSEKEYDDDQKEILGIST